MRDLILRAMRKQESQDLVLCSNIQSAAVSQKGIPLARTGVQLGLAPVQCSMTRERQQTDFLLLETAEEDTKLFAARSALLKAPFSTSVFVKGLFCALLMCKQHLQCKC